MDEKAYISKKHLAEELGMDRSHARRYVLKLGFKTQKRRTPDSGSQLTLTISAEEAEAILKNRRDKGFTAQDKVVESDAGVFYVMQLVPEFDPKRIKLGFAIDLNDRLVQHRTAAPTAKVLQSWPCKRTWEVTVMDCLSSVACRHILNEVFECDSLDDLVRRGDELFRILSDPKRRAELLEHSPHRECEEPNSGDTILNYLLSLENGLTSRHGRMTRVVVSGLPHHVPQQKIC